MVALQSLPKKGRAALHGASTWDPRAGRQLLLLFEGDNPPPCDEEQHGNPRGDGCYEEARRPCMRDEERRDGGAERGANEGCEAEDGRDAVGDAWAADEARKGRGLRSENE